MSIKYGLAVYDKYTASVTFDIDLPMENVVGGNLYEFLQSAGENGWELCGSFPAGTKGFKRAIGSKGELKECLDSAEEIALIFKLVE